MLVLHNGNVLLQNIYNDLMESELKAASSLGKLLGQQNSFLHAEYLIELVETFLRHDPARTRSCGTSALGYSHYYEKKHLCLP